MADIVLGVKKNLVRVGKVEEIEVENGANSVQLIVADDYSTIGIQVLDAEGAVVSTYDADLTLRG